MLVLIAPLTLIIGVSLGATGYGGFIVPILLVVIMDMDPRAAVAHGLISFLPAGVIGALLHWRQGNRPSWSILALLCLGTLPGIEIGRLISTALPDRLLQLLVAVLVAAAGLSLVIPRPTTSRPAHREHRSVMIIAALLAGVLAGAVSVVAGVGGPLITVPMLMSIGLEAGPVVAAALLNSVFNAALAPAALARAVHFDWTVLLIITAGQLAGIPVGVWLHHKIGDRLRPAIAIMAVSSSCWLAATAFQ